MVLSYFLGGGGDTGAKPLISYVLKQGQKRPYKQSPAYQNGKRTLTNILVTDPSKLKKVNFKNRKKKTLLEIYR